MWIDGNALAGAAPIVADVCIVGAGAAGICLATELAGARLDVVLLESGGPSVHRASQDLSRGELPERTTHSPLHVYRPRVIGGSSTVWGGRCVPLDAIDFERREYVPHSGWPLSREELLPYYARATAFVEAGACEYGAREALSAADGATGLASEVLLTDGIERFSPPTDFARRYRSVLKSAPNVRLVYNATCTHVGLHPDGKRVEKLTVKSIRGDSFEVHARRVILASGCLEATRLLLASDDVRPGGIGNHSGMLGRCYISHIEGRFGGLRLSPAVSDLLWGYRSTRDGIYARRRFTIAPDAQRRLGITNTVLRLHRKSLVDPDHTSGILSAAFLAKNLFLPKHKQKLTSFERSRLEKLGATGKHLYWLHVRNVVMELPELLAFAPRWMRSRVLSRRKMPSLLLKSGDGAYAIDVNAEQVPDPDNRVTLIGERDRLGMPRIRVDWRMGEADRHTVRTALHLLRDELRRTGTGDLTFETAELEEQIGACAPIGPHQSGTARMSDAPEGGVVDRDCRVHGIENLYVAGSAVFPTVGHANPMLTIVALALRTADHLRESPERHPEVRMASVAKQDGVGRRLAIDGGRKLVRASGRDLHKYTRLLGAPRLLPHLRGKGSIALGTGAVARFEERFAALCGTKYALAMNSGTATLHSALFALGVGPGDEVILPSYTWHATASAVMCCGAKPVFCDIDPSTLTADPKDIRARVTARTRAIIAVHLWGNPAEMQMISAIAREHGLGLVEDCSHAHGASYKGRPVGSWGDIGCFSLHQSKALGVGEGGIAVCSDPKWFDRMLALGHPRRVEVGLEQEEYDLGAMHLGPKYRPHPVVPALGLVGLAQLPAVNRLRRRNWSLLCEGLAGCEEVRPAATLPGAERGGFLEFKLVLAENVDRDRFVAAAVAEGVPVTPDRYRFLHEASIFRAAGPLTARTLERADRGPPPSLPQTEALRGRLITLPPWTRVSQRFVRQCARALAEVGRAVATSPAKGPAKCPAPSPVAEPAPRPAAPAPAVAPAVAASVPELARERAPHETGTR